MIIPLIIMLLFMFIFFKGIAIILSLFLFFIVCMSIKSIAKKTK